MDLAGKGKLNEKKSADNCSSCLPGLPDLDLHSSKDDDHGGKNRVAEELLDDIDTVLRANANGKVSISKERETKLSRIKNDGDLPLIKCPEMSPGQLGILMSKNADGHTYYTPFIAAAADKQVQGHASSSINVNERAAKELHIDGAFKKGAVPKVDIIALPQEPPSPTSPRSTGELNQVVMDKFHNMSIEIRDKQAADRAAAEADLPEPPAPDPEFGYKRTDRSTEELRKIADNYTNLARESLKATAPEGVEDRMKEFGKQAQADIDKYQGEINHNKTDKRHLQEQEETLLHQKAKLAPDSQALI